MKRNAKFFAAGIAGTAAIVAPFILFGGGPSNEAKCRAEIQSRINAAILNGLDTMDSTPYGPCAALGARYDAVAGDVLSKNLDSITTRSYIDAFGK